MTDHSTDPIAPKINARPFLLFLLALALVVTAVVVPGRAADAGSLGGYISRHYTGSDVTYLTVDCANPDRNIKIPRGKSSVDAGCRDVNRIYVNTGCTAPLSVGKGPYWFAINNWTTIGVGLSC